MSATPAGFLIEAFLVTLNAVPTHIVWAIVISDRFDDMGCLPITPFAATGCVFQQ